MMGIDIVAKILLPASLFVGCRFFYMALMSSLLLGRDDACRADFGQCWEAPRVSADAPLMQLSLRCWRWCTMPWRSDPSVTVLASEK